MPIVSSKGMFVNSDWMSRDAIKQGRGEKEGGEQNIFFHVKSVNITFLPVHNMKGFSLYIEQDLSDKK